MLAGRRAGRQRGAQPVADGAPTFLAFGRPPVRLVGVTPGMQLSA
jgi:hypothetical protein